MLQIVKKYPGMSVFLVLLFLAVCWYARSVQLFFIQDDFVWLWKAQASWSDWRRLFQTDIGGFFMPLVSAYFAVVDAIVGHSSAVFHGLNVVWHALNAFLVFYLAKRLIRRDQYAFITAVLFVTFRFPADTILWVSAVTELISTTLLLAAGLAWASFLESKKWSSYAMALIAGILLIFTKEWASLLLPLMVWIAAWDYGNKRREEKRLFIVQTLYALIPFVGLTIGYFGFQFWLQHARNPLLVRGHYVLGWHAIGNVIKNITLTVIPSVNRMRAHAFSGLVGSVAMFVAMTVFAAWRWRSAHERLPLFSLAWMVIAFLPTAFFTWDPYVSRYGYIPSIGTALFLASVVMWAWNQKIPIIRYVAPVGLLVYVVSNGLFVQRTMSGSYVPVHELSRRLSLALRGERERIQQARAVGLWNTGPHSTLVLKHVVAVETGLSIDQIHVLNDTDVCPGGMTCLAWDKGASALKERASLTE